MITGRYETEKQCMKEMEKIKEIFIKISGKPELYIEEYFDSPLTGEIMNFSMQDMIYLLIEIEEAYEIHFSKNDVEAYQFNTLNNIFNIVRSKLG